MTAHYKFVSKNTHKTRLKYHVRMQVQAYDDEHPLALCGALISRERSIITRPAAEIERKHICEFCIHLVRNLTGQELECLELDGEPVSSTAKTQQVIAVSKS